jgi:hypothetical protein
MHECILEQQENVRPFFLIVRSNKRRMHRYQHG